MPREWIYEDFSTYTSTSQLLADPRRLYTAELSNPERIVIDSEVHYGESTRSMRYTFPDRTESPGRCSDYTIGSNIDFPHSVQEVWVEVAARFSRNFTTRAPASWGCRSNPDYKFVFGRTFPDQRFSLSHGTFGTTWRAAYPGGAALRLPLRSLLADGRWHVYRIHMRHSTSPVSRDGVFRVWIDGKPLLNEQHINTSSSEGKAIEGIHGIALGRNLNQGPAREQSLWWGLVRVWRHDPGW